MDWQASASESLVGIGVLASAATGVMDFIQTEGGDVDRILGPLGIDPSSIGDPQFSMSLRTYCALFEDAAQQTGNSNFGLRFGQQFEPQDLGLLGYACLSSPTLASAIDNLVALLPFHQQATRTRLSHYNGLLKLEYQITDGSIVARRHDAELSLGMFCNIFRHCHGSHWCPEQILFEHPKPEGWKEHQHAFRSNVYFGQESNAIVFRQKDLQVKMPHGDTRLLTIVRSALMRLGRCHLEREPNLIDRCRAVIRKKLAAGCPSLEEVSDELHIPKWTLQRRLAIGSIAFKDLVDLVRKELAAAYLKDPCIPITDLAPLLGYSEASAFSRAFRRWYGAAASDYRKTLNPQA